MKKNNVADKELILLKIKKLMSEAKIDASEDQLEKLATLVILLCKWNNALNLTAIRDPNDMVVLHILDSAVLSPLIKDKGNNIADVGTGAGFPGLVLAILNPETKFTLIDSIAKKLSFVRTAMVSLNLKNVQIINDRCENIEIENKFDCIVSRAFAPLCKIVEWCKNLISDNGIFIAMKANLDEKEISEIPSNAQLVENIELHVPTLDAKRQAVIIKLQNS
ncbi:MAG: 16S rRNA (guanine(527)-N(7))-methyltransferase RsmG [Succinivibrio sp.]|nr:16S rRNA (guanine(527)-N(7))-methyltransferase RsmG [Succinivibrio sp.]MCI7784686.1 16S rRNA (guanine(527)-N(7))-methyltransferase RsmG [Succinivibrio sp.]